MIFASYNLGVKSCFEVDLTKGWDYFIDQLSEQPEHTDSLHCLANLAFIESRVEEALMFYRKAKAVNSSSVSPLALLYQKGESFKGTGEIFWVSTFSVQKLHEAANSSSYSSGASTQQLYKDLMFQEHLSMGLLLENYGLMDQAKKHYQSAAELHPTDPIPRIRSALSAPVIYQSREHLLEVRKRLEEEVQALWEDAMAGKLSLSSLSEMSMPGTFLLAYQGFNDAAIIKQIQEAYVAMYPPLEEVSVQPLPWNKNRKIRVGFASSFFRRHSVCKLVCGIIHNLDRTVFEVVVFSSTPKEDSWTEYVKQDAEFVSVKTMLLQNRYLVTRKKLDILVYPDIGMDTPTTIWAFARLAPVQVCFWGHPVTTGLPHMDYFITSDLFEPDQSAQERFTEQLLRMDSLSFYFFDPQSTFGNKTNNVIRDEVSQSNKHWYGIPEGSTFVVCPQSLMKFHPDFDYVLHSILKEIENCYIALVHDRKRQFFKEQLIQRMRKHGTASETDRVLYIEDMPHSEFVLFLAKSDLMIDTFPFGGGVTSLEAFHFCKPVVTFPFKQSVPSLTAGMLHAIDMHNDLVASDINVLINQAVRLLRNTSMQLDINSKLCLPKTRQILYQNNAVIKEWETVFQKIVYI